LEQFCDLQHSRGDVRFTPESGQIVDRLGTSALAIRNQ
jgi:hypothetical protein